MSLITFGRCIKCSSIHKMTWIFLILISAIITECSSPWQEWWMYEGVSGPHYWGKINTRWVLCSKGKNQSPIDIEPKHLLFDPGLKHLKITGRQINGTLENKGTDLTFELRDYSKVFISEGPLSYTYRLHQIKFHFGGNDLMGSEHSVGRKHFAAEMQMMFYNSDLYSNYTHAVNLSRGLVILAIFLKVTDNETHTELSKITSNLEDVKHKGDKIELSYINLKNLIPEGHQYMTYEGSITQPGCHETVTWIIMNRPIIIHRDQINALRQLRQDTPENPQALMYNNFRPVQNLNQRTVRTNINFANKSCSMQRDMRYKRHYLVYLGTSLLRLSQSATILACTVNDVHPQIKPDTTRSANIGNKKEQEQRRECGDLKDEGCGVYLQIELEKCYGTGYLNE